MRKAHTNIINNQNEWMNELREIKRIPICSFERNGSFRFFYQLTLSSCWFIYFETKQTNICHPLLWLMKEPYYLTNLNWFIFQSWLMIYILPYILGLLWTIFFNMHESHRSKNRICNSKTNYMIKPHLWLTIYFFQSRYFVFP